MIRILLAAGIFCITLTLALAGQDFPVLQQAPQSPARPAPAKPEEDAPFTLSVDTRLVQIPVSVTTKEGKTLDNLPQSSFQIFEDNVLQEITIFKHEDVPLSLGLVIDNSGSMRNKRQRVNSAALTFVRESNMDDETFIVDFDDEAILRQQFTGSMSDLVDALSDINTQG
jgi:VWFA-related protein